MAEIKMHNYKNTKDFERILDFTQKTWTPNSQYHIGDLAWGRFQHINKENDWVTAIWELNGEMIGWGWIELPSYLNFSVDPNYPEAANMIIKWFEDKVTSNELTTMVLNKETQLLEALQNNEYLNDPAEPFFTHMAHPLKNLAEPILPGGFIARPIRGEEDLKKRVDAHRAAWHPSKVCEDSYRNVMMTKPYKKNLDWIVESTTGKFVSYCLIWMDEKNGVGLLEPIGTHPDYRKLGLARAVCLHALHELKKEDAHTAIVKPRGDDAYPLPAKFYRSLGFRSYNFTKTYTKHR